MGQESGCVYLYIDDDIKYIVKRDLEKIKHHESTETLLIEIERQVDKNVIVNIFM